MPLGATRTIRQRGYDHQQGQGHEKHGKRQKVGFDQKHLPDDRDETQRQRQKSDEDQRFLQAFGFEPPAAPPQHPDVAADKDHESEQRFGFKIREQSDGEVHGGDAGQDKEYAKDISEQRIPPVTHEASDGGFRRAIWGG